MLSRTWMQRPGTVMDFVSGSACVSTTSPCVSNTFSQRMRDYGINVELLCRLRTPSEQKKTIEGLKKGSVDIVIGTHRLLSKSVSYKNLGLLMIDEEQRFGVTHKEKLKQMKNDIDVLTLTATPIPRTLHMSLVGIRDMSVLEEPPVDRMPIQTFVMEKSEPIVREAILREIGRGGQVYYVYNRVGNMDIVANEIAKLVPEAVVAFAHGQMNERELERTMFRFVEGEIDVLVATTIVETGLDIPNVNTIIIEDADRLGLSQLYQLRGRVGRSNRTAYAFLLYKRDKLLKEVAEKRLAAIKEQEKEDTSTVVYVPTDSDQYLLGAIIQCEAGGESYDGKLAVGSVVINRVKSSYFPNSVSGVIYQSGQFSPVASGRLAYRLEAGVDGSCLQAAQDVLNGNITVGCLYFRQNNGIIQGTVIGNHVFY